MATVDTRVVPATDAGKFVFSAGKLRGTPWEQAHKRREQLIALMSDGMNLHDCLGEIGVSYSSYKKWRAKHPHFAAQVDIIRAGGDTSAAVKTWTGDHASFCDVYLNGWRYAPHQLQAIEAYKNTPAGHILVTLWPPDHGKTATFENFATEQLATDPTHYRGTITSESLTISKKILGGIKNRLEPNGPFPELVRRFGPFKPPSGQSRENQMAQPWSDQHFNVFKKQKGDHRDYSLQALGFKSSIVSTRATHLHIDDMQSDTTSQPTHSRKVESYIRKDCLTRTGAHGINTVACTLVAHDDAISALLDDQALAPYMKVLKFPAIRMNYATGKEEALFPERYDLDQLEAMKAKVGEEIWQLSYMHNSRTVSKDRTFKDEVIERAKSKVHSLNTIPERGEVLYVTLDPALGGQNCVMALQPTNDGKLVIRWVQEQRGFTRNEEIMGEVALVVGRMKMGGATVSDLVVEENNFQKGLANDDRMIDLTRKHSMVARGHLSGANKYDPDIGIPSMAGSMNSGEIIIPDADDPITQLEMGELVAQLISWKPGQRGNRYRMDRLMALWFGWILWQERWKKPPDPNGDAFRRKGMPWQPTQAGILVPRSVTTDPRSRYAHV